MAAARWDNVTVGAAAEDVPTATEPELACRTGDGLLDDASAWTVVGRDAGWSCTGTLAELALDCRANGGRLGDESPLAGEGAAGWSCSGTFAEPALGCRANGRRLGDETTLAGEDDAG